jgi:gluconolactonase
VGCKKPLRVGEFGFLAVSALTYLGCADHGAGASPEAAAATPVFEGGPPDDAGAPDDAGEIRGSDRSSSQTEASIPDDVSAPNDSSADVEDDGSPTDGGISTDAWGDSSHVEAGGSAYRKVGCPPGPFPAPVGSNRQNVCPGFPLAHTWNEGPVWIASQNAFFFSNWERGTPDAAASYFNGDIIKYTPSTGQCEFFVRDVGSNGLGIASDGNLLATSQLTRNVVEFDLVTKQSKVVADNYMGKKLNTPNDIIVHSNGTVYFSNPPFELGGRTEEMPPSVVRIDPAGAISLVETGGAPNGVTLSPDERRLYVAHNGMGIRVFDLDPTGVPAPAPRPFTSVGTDGMSADCAGNVYLGNGGPIIGPSGVQVGTIPGGGGTMPRFGGPNGTTLLIAGPGKALASVTMNLPGL